MISHHQRRRSYQRLLIAGALAALGAASGTTEQRNDVSYLRGPYNIAFYKRHNTAFRISAALHFSHAKQHDVLLLTPLADAARADAAFDQESLDFALKRKARTEPTQELFAPWTARAFWRVLRTIDWTHMHHEQTYDILASRPILWAEKKRWTDRAVAYYLKNDVAFSVAPLDVTMRRAAVMMKPYFTLFRNNYPRSNNYFYAAHWWHPVIYEAQMLGGNGEGQDRMVRETDETFYREVLRDRPQKMLLLREAAPLYSRMTPESANIFDNLHMFHGIVYDIMAYEGWTYAQKRAELNRVIAAMRYRPGDERLARKFTLPHPSVDPRVYEAWMRSPEGEMSRIMMEMMEEMMPHMMPGDMEAAHQRTMHEQMMAQMKLKLTPGQQEGELPGSLHDAMMKMMPGSIEPGEASPMMVDAMLRGWEAKYGSLPDIPPLPMDTEPSPPAGAAVSRRP